MCVDHRTEPKGKRHRGVIPENAGKTKLDSEERSIAIFRGKSRVGDDRCRNVIVQPGEVTGVQCGTGRLSVRKITPRFSSGKKILTGLSLLELFNPRGKESGL